MPPHALAIGYRRARNGNVEPVCEPPVDALLLELWRFSHCVTLDTDAFLVRGTTDDATLRFQGSMQPHELARQIWGMASDTLAAMRTLIALIERHYPFASGARHIVERSNRLHLIDVLDGPFIETETPRETHGGQILVPPPKISLDGGRLRVTVAGNPEGQFLRAWADGIIADRMRETVLDLLANESNDTFA